MEDLRSLGFSISYDVDGNPIKSTDKSVDKLKKNTKGLGDVTQKTEKQFGSFGGTLKTFGGVAAGIIGFGAIKAGYSKLIDEGANLQESTNKFAVVFGDSAKEANAWADQYADAIGRSAVETKYFMGETGDLLTGFGASQKAAFKLSSEIQKTAVDLASFNNLADDDALERYQGMLMGNHENGIKLGIVLNENVLKQEAINMGYKKGFEKLTPLQKLEVRHSAALKQTKNAVGDAARSQGTYTAELKRNQGMMKDLAATLGMKLLPEMTELLGTIGDNKDAIINFVTFGVDVGIVAIDLFGNSLEFVSKNADTLTPVILGLGGAFATFSVLSSISAAMTTLGMSFTFASVGGYLLGGAIAFITSPIFLISAAVGVAIGAIYALWKNWEKVTTGIKNTWEGFKSAFTIGGGTGIGEKKHTVTTATGQSKSISMYADGTMSSPKGAAIINEKGGEIRQLNSGERIYPASETNRIIKNEFSGKTKTSGGSVTISPNITIKVDGSKDPKVTAAEIKKEINAYFKEMSIKYGMEPEVV